MNERREFWAVRHRDVVNQVGHIRGVHVERIHEGEVDERFCRPIIGIYPTEEAAKTYPARMLETTAWANVMVFDFGGDVAYRYIEELKGPFRAVEFEGDNEHFITDVFGSREQAEEFDCPEWNPKRLHL